MWQVKQNAHFIQEYLKKKKKLKEGESSNLGGLLIKGDFSMVQKM